MALQDKVRLGLACAAALAIAGCVAGSGGSGSDGAGATVQGGAFSPVTVERDVEAPEVFSLTGEGLWDGRPSLGGVWVAYSTVKDPERVMIRNARNGKSVVGALFRRERELPGPGLQVSSDAAEALGMLAGQPADLSVVALRREEKPVPPDAEIGAEDAPAEGATPPEAAEGAPADAVVAAPGADVAPEAAPDGDAVAAAPLDARKKKSGGLFGFLKKKPKPDPVVASPATVTATAGAGAGAIEQSTLDPVAASAAAAIDRAEAGTPAPQPAPAPQPSPVPAPALNRAYIQIGIFSVEANADRAAEQMKAAGMTATVRADTSNGKSYWRVIVGPAASVAERDALVARVKGVGYPDAYPVSN